MKGSCSKLGVMRGRPTPVPAGIKQVSYCVEAAGPLIVGALERAQPDSRQKQMTLGPTKLHTYYLVLEPMVYDHFTSMGNKNIIPIFWLRKRRF